METTMMLRVIRRETHLQGEISDSLILPFALRQKGRFRTTSQSGLDVGIFLPRGDVLHEGDCLMTECGRVLKVIAEQEQVVTASCDDWVVFAKACYHMGNRHVPMQIGECWLRFQPDHVLQAMIERMGLTCTQHRAAFTPENGAYHGGGHHHHHDDHHHHHGDHDDEAHSHG